MESRIEDGHLRHRTQQFTYNVYAFEIGLNVQRRKGLHVGDEALHLGRDKRALHEILKK